MDEEIEEVNDTDEPTVYLYVEKATGHIVECQLFESFVLYRPAIYGMENHVARVSNVEFANDFEEYAGDYKDYYNFTRGLSNLTLTILN
jgi:hypothetical protein